MFKSGDDSVKNRQNIETIIGPSVKVEGEFVGDGDVIVEGIVVGTLKTKNHLRIGENAKVQAEVEAGSAYIAGEVNGNISCEGEIDMKTSSKVHGDLSCSAITIEKGAVFNGRISMGTQKKNKELQTANEK